MFSYCGRSGGGWRVREPGCNLYRTLDTRKAGLQCASARVASVQSTGRTLLCNTDTHTSSLQTHRQKDKGSKALPFPVTDGNLRVDLEGCKDTANRRKGGLQPSRVLGANFNH